MAPIARTLTAVAVAVLLVATTADAALTTGACLAQKRVAWGDLRKCQATERAKALKGKSADLARCQTKFQAKLTKINDKATKAVIPCRYGDNGDGTVTDYATGLQWERKDGDLGGICLIFSGVVSHCVNTTYTWADAQSFVSGASADGTTVASFRAGYADWRLPTIVELETILLAPYPSCGTIPCIDPIFGPTAAGFYKSATTNANGPSNAWDVNFNNGDVGYSTKDNNGYVRAVRTGL
jgi:hypothetical protein